MRVKTGRQVFKEQIFDKIDLTIHVNSVLLDSDPDVQFSVCDLKWLKPNSVLFGEGGSAWNVNSIDYEQGVITALRPNGTEELKPGKVFLMSSPLFKSGTPKNLNGEIALDEEADVITTFPIVWLLESIKGKRYDSKNVMDREFSFKWYVLDETKVDDYNNEDRHINGVIPMSQLGESICHVVEQTNKQIKLVNEVDFNEFNLFGRESASGFENYILNKNLSGLGYQAKVAVTHSVCTC